MTPELRLDSRDARILAAMLQACASQVDAEIATMVGKKYIPELYVERGVQAQLDQLIHPERYIQRLPPESEDSGLASKTSPMMSPRKESQGGRSAWVESIESAAPIEVSSLVSLSLPRLLLDALSRESKGRLYILTARAGSGKTNLLCHLAKHYAQEQPTVFLTGRSGVSEKTSIKDLIESRVGGLSISPLPKEERFERLVSVISRQNTRLLVFLDAINEHRDLELLNSAIAHFLLDIRGQPVTLIASCRDVYWSSFDTSKWPEPQWSRLDMELGPFSASEFAGAVQAYFDYFNIRASLSEEASHKLAQPLVLRLFCEAFGDPSATSPVELPEIHDIRLKALFDEYLARKLGSIRYTAPRRGRTAREIEDILFSLADTMRRTKTSEISRNAVPKVTKQADIESLESAYGAILGEDIIIQETMDAETSCINVAFTFDEFMEYMIARSMIHECRVLNRRNIEGLVKECHSGVESFPSYAGVFEYLALILREDHGLNVWDHVDLGTPEFGNAAMRAITRIGPELIGEPEVRILARMIQSPSRTLRDAGVFCLKLLAGGKRYEKGLRAQAVEFLRDVLAHEDDFLIRAEAIECFEDDEVVSLSEVAWNIASWWRKEKEGMRSKVILCLEPERDLRQLIKHTLELAGFDQVTCKVVGYWDIFDAEKFTHVAQQVRPSLILVGTISARSLHAPITAARAIPSLAEVPILVLPTTGLGLEDQRPDAFCQVIRKPFAPKDLSTSVQRILVGKLEG